MVKRYNMTQDKILNSFAQVYWPAIQKYHELISENEKANTNIQKRFTSEFRASLKWPLKHCGTLIPPKASKKALEIARQHSIDLFALQWKDQPEAEELICGERGRNIFVHEHEIPVSCIYNELLDAKSLDMVKNILTKQSIIWITEDENKLLPQYIREKDAYKKAGIEYENNPYLDNWMEKPWKTSP